MKVAHRKMSWLMQFLANDFDLDRGQWYHMGGIPTV